jgi:hypothetical protein
MWTERYKELLATVEKAGAEKVLKQLEEARSNSPELYAALSMLSMVVHQEIERLDGPEPPDTIIGILHPAVISLALASPLVLSRDRLCQILKRFAARRHFRDLATGVIREPGPGCQKQ